MRTINKILDKCNLILAVIAGIVILLLILAVCFSTLSRYLFNKPYAFLTDYATYSLLFIAFLGAPWLMQQRGHTNIDLIPNALSEHKRHMWMGCIEILVAVISAVVTYVGILVTQGAIQNNTRLSDTFGTPKWILLISIPIGCFFLTIQSIRCAAEDLRHKKEEVKKEGGEAA